ncbi:MAG: hypothetical protein IKP89_04360 [Bacteroidales bacterium]|nr:hypothetical protein [Bacteroidales bacterium]
MSSVIFNNREHFAKRDANLLLVNNQLVINNLSHPADGVIIDTAGVSGLKVDFLSHTLGQGEVIMYHHHQADFICLMMIFCCHAINQKKNRSINIK